jgi:hypothetical protein
MTSSPFSTAVALAALLLAAGTAAHARPLASNRFESAPLDQPDAYAVTTTSAPAGIIHKVFSKLFFWKSKKTGVTARAAILPEGTIDIYQGTRSPALVFTADFTPEAAPAARARVTLPSLSIANSETNLALLTLGFDLSVSERRPIEVRVSSLDASGTVTGTLAKTLLPPAGGTYFRFTEDLSTFTPDATAPAFDPTAPSLRVEFAVPAPASARARTHATDSTPAPFTLKVDNLSYSAPAYYVSPTGDDSDGRTPATAFKTLQRAANRAAPGDVIMVLDGTYVSASRQDLVQLYKAGTPDRWITLRAAPGHHPLLRGDGWRIVAMNQNSAYIEIRGFTIQGFIKDNTLEEALADGATEKKEDGSTYFGNPRFNTGGIAVDARQGAPDAKAHHIRILYNTVFECSGGGIGAIHADHITIAGNIVRDNCWWTRWAGSGISLFRAWNFDSETGYKMWVLDNEISGNRTYVPWGQFKKISDGNGIIIDDFINYQKFAGGGAGGPYLGRTLIQNNLSYGNGGSGMHAYAANHVDFIHNTAYHNGQSPELSWRDIWAGARCHDIRLLNNIGWARVGRPVNLEIYNSTEILYAHNLLYGDGDNTGPEGGGLGTAAPGKRVAESIGNLFVNPGLVNPSLDPAVADFRPAPGSPAIDAGSTLAPGVPLADLVGRPRPQGTAPDLGAYEVTPSR